MRVWDTAGLRKKHLDGDDGAPEFRPPGSQGVGPAPLVAVSTAFGTNDVVVQYVLEEHYRGVNRVGWSVRGRQPPGEAVENVRDESVVDGNSPGPRK